MKISENHNSLGCEQPRCLFSVGMCFSQCASSAALSDQECVYSHHVHITQIAGLSPQSSSTIAIGCNVFKISQSYIAAVATTML